MGKRGPKPKPTALKVANGNPGKRKLNAAEPKPQLVGCPEPPEWLDAVARECWVRHVDELERLGLLTQLDVDLLAAYCVAYSDYRAARERIQDESIGRVQVFRDDKGVVKATQVSAEWTIAKQALEQMKRLGAEFGMGPASRTGLTGKTADNQPKTRQQILEQPVALPDVGALKSIQ